MTLLTQNMTAIWSAPSGNKNPGNVTRLFFFSKFGVAEQSPDKYKAAENFTIELAQPESTSGSSSLAG